MITFIKGPDGHLAVKPSKRKGSTSLVMTMCSLCGRKEWAKEDENLDLKKCKCEKPSQTLLEYEGRKKTVDDWARVLPTVNLASARVRMSLRVHKTRNCTDQEILFGYGKGFKASTQMALDYSGEEGWRLQLISEFNNRVDKMPLREAIIQSVQIIMGSIVVGEIDSHPILTALGLQFERDGQSLVELCEMMDSVYAVKVFLSEDWQLPDNEIESYFKKGV